MEVLIKTQDKIIEHLRDLADSDLVQAHNTYCQNCNCHDDEIYNNDEEFFEVHFSKAIDAIRAANYGEYNYSDDYVVFNGYANLDSFDNPSDHVDLTEIASDILENPSDYDIDFEYFECSECGEEHETEEAQDECCQ